MKAAARADYDAKVAELKADLEETRGEKEKTDTELAYLKVCFVSAFKSSVGVLCRLEGQQVARQSLPSSLLLVLLLLVLVVVLVLMTQLPAFSADFALPMLMAGFPPYNVDHAIAREHTHLGVQPNGATAVEQRA